MTRQVWVIDRRTKEKVAETVAISGLMSWLFSGSRESGRARVATLIAKLPWLSQAVGWLACRPITKELISGFVDYHRVHLQDYEVPSDGWAHFESFFSRRLRENVRAVDKSAGSLTAPADARYRFFDPVDSQTHLWVKGRGYSLKMLLGEQSERFHLANVCLGRLCPSDYHRFHSPLDGIVKRIDILPGSLFSVHPWSLRQNFGRLLENKRALIEIEHPTQGTCLLIAIGATCVGSIELLIQQGDKLMKGQEIGIFHLGGSAIMIITEPGKWEWAEDLSELYAAHDEQCEILCQVGQPLCYHQ